MYCLLYKRQFRLVKKEVPKSLAILDGHLIPQDLDTVETGVDGVPSMNAEEDRENERKLREERLIARFNVIILPL